MAGFRLSLLSKLRFVKSSDNTTTLLHYAVSLILAQRPNERPNLGRELDSLPAACRVQWSEMDQESVHLRGLLKRAEEALERGTLGPGRVEAELRDFLAVQQAVTEDLVVRVASTKEQCRLLAEYYSIKRDEGGVEGVFRVFRDFVGTFNQTVAELDKEAGRKEREMQQKEQGGLKQAPHAESPGAAGTREGSGPAPDPMEQFEQSLQDQWALIKARRSSISTPPPAPRGGGPQDGGDGEENEDDSLKLLTKRI